MNPNKFVKDCQRTAAAITPELIGRLVNDFYLAQIFDNLNEISQVGIDLDHVKKEVFYGKPASALAKANPISHQQKLRVERHAKLIHGIIGKATELAELWDIVAQHIETGAPMDLEHVKEEIMDDMWYSTECIAAIDGDLISMMEALIAKHRKRYPDKFTEKAAEVRADKICPSCGGRCFVESGSGNDEECPRCNGEGKLK